MRMLTVISCFCTVLGSIAMEAVQKMNSEYEKECDYFDPKERLEGTEGVDTFVYNFISQGRNTLVALKKAIDNNRVVSGVLQQIVEANSGEELAQRIAFLVYRDSLEDVREVLREANPGVFSIIDYVSTVDPRWGENWDRLRSEIGAERTRRRVDISVEQTDYCAVLGGAAMEMVEDMNSDYEKEDRYFNPKLRLESTEGINHYMSNFVFRGEKALMALEKIIDDSRVIGEILRPIIENSSDEELAKRIKFLAYRDPFDEIRAALQKANSGVFSVIAHASATDHYWGRDWDKLREEVGQEASRRSYSY